MAMQKKFASPLALLVPLLLALLACAGCPVLQRQDTPVDEIQLINASTKRKYFLYVPSDYNPQQAYLCREPEILFYLPGLLDVPPVFYVEFLRAAE